jgi:hypothetical protein
MIFNIAQLISCMSEYITLYPGDLMITGTPPGVGEGRKPTAIYLKAGDVMELGIAKLGVQTQNVVAWRHLGDEVLGLRLSRVEGCCARGAPDGLERGLPADFGDDHRRPWQPAGSLMGR